MKPKLHERHLVIISKFVFKKQQIDIGKQHDAVFYVDLHMLTPPQIEIRNFLCQTGLVVTSLLPLTLYCVKQRTSSNTVVIHVGDPPLKV